MGLWFSSWFIADNSIFSLIYSTLDFIGKVKIILKAKNTNGSNIIKYSNHGYIENGTALLAEYISIERDWDYWRLNEDYR